MSRRQRWVGGGWRVACFLALLGACTAACRSQEPESEPAVPSASDAPAPPAAVLEEPERTPARAESGQPQAPITLEEMGIAASFGLRDEDGALGALQKPLDAAFLGDHVLVLDASPPWIRVFERDGRLVRGIVRSGEGPGEATTPMSLATGPGGILLTHRRGIEYLEEDGDVIQSMRRGPRFLGAMECGRVVLAAIDLFQTPAVTAIVQLDADGVPGDTLMVFTPARSGPRKYFPWFALVRDEHVLMYTEEESQHRLMELSCDGSLLRQIDLDPLGRGELIEPTERGVVVYSPASPHPGGLARIGDRVIWTERARIDLGQERWDSVTVITSYTAQGPSRRLTIQGWYQLFDSDPAGWLLFGNSWTLGQNWEYPGTWGLFPAVFLVDGRDLLRALDELGTEAGPS